MNDTLTEILFILDRSGSMQSMSSDAIAGFNQFLKQQAELPGLARLSLVLFDDQYEVPFASLPVQEVTPLTAETFEPRGMTALLDAIARGVDELGARLGSMPEQDRPGQVIVAILTDGQENSSRHYNLQQVQERIQHQTQVYSWQFFFLGANQDAIATGARMGIDDMNSANFSATGKGAVAASVAINRKLAYIRKLKSNIRLSLEEAQDMARTLDDIVAEEEAK